MALLYNQRENKEKRKALRYNQTETEAMLWNEIRGSRLGIRFRRQFGIGSYIVDFYAPRVRLVIEIDGSIHTLEVIRSNDAERQKSIEGLGLKFLRFTTEEIQGNMGLVLQRIRQLLQPSPYEGEGTSEARG